ncbi:hypothetical protein SUTMEG_14360 [Sutterella megalosphaeroides]|uniref:Uncharacterized protein n=1 Tax=Sutterella megalosphaeroides TaxID=2494234 RepID=A0A2Z6IAL2_9BURK|nr:hypothetical protein SUTMEG_14360 [Sutterella megalosphaeroides]
MEASVRRVRDGRQAVCFFGFKEVREQIEEPHGTFGLVAKVEPNGFAVSADMKDDQLCRDELVVLDAENGIPDAHRAVRRGGS